MAALDPEVPGNSHEEKPQEDMLQMFFSENFSPENYVNALHQSITGATHSKFSPTTLADITSKSQDLITHLEYNSNEILRELAEKTAQLSRMSASMGHADGSDTTEHSRLQYYVDVLKNSVETLHADVGLCRLELPDVETDHVHTLIQLKNVKANILRVVECLQKARLIVGDTTTERHFAESLQSYHESLRARSRDTEERALLEETVAELRSWAPMFQPFTRFGPAYSKFALRLDDIA